MNSSQYEVSTDPDRIDLDLVHGFLSRSYWAEGRSRELVERSIKNSLCFGVYLSQEQVAFARVISDKAVFAYLADVFVVPSFRGHGISKLLMRRIVEHPHLHGIQQFLLLTRDAHGLYDQFGFRRCPQVDRLMVKYNQNGDKRAT